MRVDRKEIVMLRKRCKQYNVQGWHLQFNTTHTPFSFHMAKLALFEYNLSRHTEAKQVWETLRWQGGKYRKGTIRA